MKEDEDAEDSMSETSSTRSEMDEVEEETLSLCHTYAYFLFARTQTNKNAIHRICLQTQQFANCMVLETTTDSTFINS
jgi:hypothetical protein